MLPGVRLLNSVSLQTLTSGTAANNGSAHAYSHT